MGVVAFEPARARKTGAVPPPVLTTLGRSSGGRPLEQATCRRFEHAYRANFADVRVYDDAEAADAADTLGADAFAVDRRLFFAPGRYRPDSVQGTRLLAHELAHTLQASESASGVSRVGDRDERAASAAADTALRGSTPGPIPSAASLVLRQQRPAPTAHFTYQGHEYTGSGTDQEWLDGFLEFADFDAVVPRVPRDVDTGETSHARFAGQTQTLGQITSIVVTEATLAGRTFSRAWVLGRLEAQREFARDPGKVSMQSQVAPLTATGHLALGTVGPGTPRSSVDPPGFQLVPAAFVLPGHRADRPGVDVTVIPAQLSFFYPSALQSALAGAQVAYTWPVSEHVQLQGFLQGLAGFAWPSGSALTQEQGGAGFAAAYAFKLPQDWQLQIQAQVTTAYTHTDFPSPLRQGDMPNTIDVGGALVIVLQSPGAGRRRR